MANPLFGNWKLKENENFDAYMAAIGVGWVLRKAGAAASSTTAITDEAGAVRIATTSTVKSSNNLFKFGVQNDETTLDGRTSKTTIEWDGNTLVETQTWGNPPKSTTIRWSAEGDKMTATLDMDGIICKRFHERVAK